MRTAEEIYNQVFDESDPFSLLKDIYINAINQARIEAIEECSKIATETLMYAEVIDYGLPKEFQELIDKIK